MSSLEGVKDGLIFKFHLFMYATRRSTVEYDDNPPIQININNQK